MPPRTLPPEARKQLAERTRNAEWTSKRRNAPQLHELSEQNEREHRVGLFSVGRDGRKGDFAQVYQYGPVRARNVETSSNGPLARRRAQQPPASAHLLARCRPASSRLAELH